MTGGPGRGDAVPGDAVLGPTGAGDDLDGDRPRTGDEARFSTILDTPVDRRLRRLPGLLAAAAVRLCLEADRRGFVTIVGLAVVDAITAGAGGSSLRRGVVRRALALEHGRVTEHGSHAELMARGGTYGEPFTLRAAAFAEPGPA